MGGLCDYGCGQRAEYKTSNGKLCCSKNWQACPAMKKKNSQGLKKAFERGDKTAEHLDGHRDWRKGKTFIEKGIEEAKTKNCIKKGLIKNRSYKCEGCGEKQHRNEKIPLEIHRIDGTKTYEESTAKNFKLLCPNCHAQTDNYRRQKSSIKGGKKVSDEELITALENNKNIRQALLSVDLKGKGGNYKRCRRLIGEESIEIKKGIDCDKTKNKCKDCETEISRGAERCKSCATKHKDNIKIDWPETEWLKEMTEKYSYLALSRRLGVSDNGIRKRIKTH